MTYTSSPSLLAGDFFTGTLNRIAGKNVGTYAVQQNSLTASANYAITFVPGKLAITPKTITLTPDAKSKVYGSADPLLTYSITPALETGDSFSGVLLRSVGQNTGTYPINQNTLSPGLNYTVIYQAANLTITNAPLKITADNKTRVQGTANPLLTASYAGFVYSDNNTALSVQPTLSTIASENSEPGSYQIIASGAAALNYEITYTPGVLTVVPSPPVITSFTPTTAGTGTTITITGKYFTGASAVSFGGTPVASFTVLSSTSITAVVGSGSSGDISVTTAIGTGVRAGFSFLPKPVITPLSQTTFATGKQVILNVNTGSGYSYQWARNGTPIVGATASSYTATETGSYTATITLNSFSLTSDAISVTTIYTLPVTNFRIITSDETCRDSNNGKISITSESPKDYTAVITGNGLNTTKVFTSNVEFASLAAGTYTVCITIAGQSTYKQCFNMVVTEPKDLAVYASVKNENKIDLELQGGTTYKIVINDKIYYTTDQRLSLPLNKGNNIVKVSTDKLCQGTIEKQIYINEGIKIYPNPFGSTLNLEIADLNFTSGRAELLKLNADLVYKQNFTSNGHVVVLEPGDIKSGIYVLKIIIDNTQLIYKVIKK